MSTPFPRSIPMSATPSPRVGLPVFLSRRAWVALVGLFLLALVPTGAEVSGTPYAINLATRFLIYGLAAVSLDLVLGYGAMVSFGHAMFFGVGGYVVAIVAHHALEAGPVFVWSGSRQALVVWPLALACCGLLGAAVGYLALRTRGVQFIMITLAFGQLVYFVLMSLQVYGGDDGLLMSQRNVVPGLDLDDPVVFYYLCLGLLAAWTFLCARVVGSRFGMVLQALRQSERRAVNLGVAPPARPPWPRWPPVPRVAPPRRWRGGRVGGVRATGASRRRRTACRRSCCRPSAPAWPVCCGRTMRAS